MNEITNKIVIDNNYEQNNCNTTDDDELDENNKPEYEGDQDAKWLEEVGLEEIAQNFKNGEVIDDEVVFKHTATLTRRQAMSVIKRVNTLNDTIRRKRSVTHQNGSNNGGGGGGGAVNNLVVDNNNNNTKRNSLSSTSVSALAQTMLQQQQQHQQQQQQHQHQHQHQHQQHQQTNFFRSAHTLQNQSLSPQQFYNNNIQTSSTSRISSLNEDHIGQIKLISYKGIDTQLKDDEIRLVELRNDKTDGFEDFKSYALENKSRIGVTNINDMSTNDIDNMQNLALLNLTALFDEYNLNFIRKKSKQRKNKESGLFGVSLNTLLENDRKRSIRYRVPYLFKKLIDILRMQAIKTEGILRVPGSAVRVKNVVNELNSSYSSDNCWSKLTPNDVADLLKIFLRELPQPLLTNEYYQSFTQILYINDIKDKIYGFMNLILLLPPVHRDTLKMLLEFLYDIVENCEFNKMNLTSVSVIMAPNLFLSNSNIKKYSVLNDAERSVNDQMIDVVKYLIKYHKLIWLIPNDVIKQFRLLNEQKSKKSKPVLSRLLQTIRSSNSSNTTNNKRKDELLNFQIKNGNIENIDFLVNIKIDNYPTFTSLTAGEFVQHLLRENFKEYKDLKLILNEINNSQIYNNSTYYYSLNDNLIPKDGLYLFEQDGNLISRRIDHYVRIKDIKDENPLATWSIRYWSFYRV